MIHNESEYKETLKRLQEGQERLASQERELSGMGLGPNEIKRVIDPVRSFQDDLAQEVQLYERAKNRDFDEIVNLESLGKSLVYFRIAKGLSQADMARSLEIDPSQVSRDERNEYFGITIERLEKTLRALGVTLRSRVDFGATVLDDSEAPIHVDSPRWPTGQTNPFTAITIFRAASIRQVEEDQVILEPEVEAGA